VGASHPQGVGTGARLIGLRQTGPGAMLCPADARLAVGAVRRMTEGA
jgi:hypothetical protein